MQNKNIFYIIFGNILWSLIPVIVFGLFNEISIITIIFLRFFVSGIILMIIAVLITYINNKYSSNQPLRLKDLFKFTYSKNESFFKLRYIYYFAIIGFFGIILQLIFFFLALKISSVSLTMIGFQIAIIIVAIYEHGAQSEKLDKFKGLYIIILVFSIGIIILVKSQESGRFSLIGFLYIIIFTLCLTFFQITIDKDSYSKDEIKLINKNELYKVPRLLIKISFTFFMGIMLMIPFVFIIYLIPVQTDLTTEIGQFYRDLSNIFQILLRWEILFLILGSTIFPYLLIFIAYAKWSPYNLTYRQWNCILTIIEPIGGIFFGVLLGVDSFPIELLVIVLFLLIITILLRYIHESTNKVNAYLLLSKKKGALKGLSLKILKFSGVFSIQSLVGTHDILVYIRTNSFREFRYLVDDKIRKLKEIENIKILFINKIIKITS
ncbi:MAG: hypothetical protein EU529_16020 [Promethearchaeota archaeon]|nr:MAG: hypothetical protein EU529_16020 [Candidatus Lokiarchaeota archaeon]